MSRYAITDAGLVHLAKLARVESLDLRGTRITDAGLVHLNGLPRLQWLRVGRTQISDAAREKLAKARPNLRIAD